MYDSTKDGYSSTIFDGYCCLVFVFEVVEVLFKGKDHTRDKEEPELQYPSEFA